MKIAINTLAIFLTENGLRLVNKPFETVQKFTENEGMRNCKEDYIVIYDYNKTIYTINPKLSITILQNQDTNQNAFSLKQAHLS